VLKETFSKLIQVNMYAIHILFRKISNKMFYHHCVSVLLCNTPLGRVGNEWVTSASGLC
jgi:hypothetical protein